MISNIITFIKLPMLLVLIWSLLRFSLGVFFGVPYAPRGNAMFSLVGLTLISSIYYGAISHSVMGYDWKGTLLTGTFIGLSAQIFIFVLSIVSLAAGLEGSYYIHWDSINIQEGESMSMGGLVQLRFVGIIVNCIIAAVAASIGRALSGLAPRKP